MKYCIFGGSFDPPHEGHVHLARSASSSLRFDKVLWVPAQDPPHKDKPGTPFQQRVEMVRLATAGIPGSHVSDIEGRLPSPSYSLNTIQALKAQYGTDHEWHFLIGADNWAIIESWHRWEQVMKEVTLVVYPREGHPLQDLPVTVAALDMAVFPGASGKIREALSRGTDPVSAGVLPEIRNYIRTHGLYGSKISTASDED